MSHHQRTRAVAITIAAQYLTDITGTDRTIDADLGVHERDNLIYVDFGDSYNIRVDRDGRVYG